MADSAAYERDADAIPKSLGHHFLALLPDCPQDWAGGFRSAVPDADGPGIGPADDHRWAGRGCAATQFGHREDSLGRTQGTGGID